ncbi:hypothetical protein UlMin_022160 [Ulmus minor]
MAATLFSEPRQSHNYSISHQQFDLDEVLNFSYTNYDHTVESTATTKAESDDQSSIVNCMPSVVTTTLDSCAVCMESFLSGESGKRVPCGHVYHATCITAWLAVCNSCPLCRSGISDAQQISAAKQS